MNFARVFAAQPSLPSAQLVSVESDLARGLHAFSIVGLPDKAVDLIDEAASRLKIEIESMPTEIDQMERQIMMLEMERQALRKEKDAVSRERLEKLEKELAGTKES